jgi:hypothetical protein
MAGWRRRALPISRCWQTCLRAERSATHLREAARPMFATMTFAPNLPLEVFARRRRGREATTGVPMRE